MFRPLALFIGLRYTRAKRRNHFVSFIALSSMLGIALGVTVLITVLSVMNGFDNEIRARVFSLAPQVTISKPSGKIEDWQSLAGHIQHYPGIIQITPFIAGQGLLSNLGTVRPTVITGVDPAGENKISQISEKMLRGHLSDLKSGQYGIILGVDLAESLGLSLGDKVVLMIPQSSVTPVGVLPRFKRFTVKGVFQAGKGFGFDDRLAFIDLKDAQTLYQLGDAVTGLRLKLKNFYDAPSFSVFLRRQLDSDYRVGNWTQSFGALFHAISLEKTMMFLILLLIIAVAAFNLLSSLVMIVNDKRADIAILRSYGATPRTILATFMVQGMVVGVIGTLLGLIGGIVLSLNATRIVAWLQSVLHQQLISANVYFVNYLPSDLQAADVIKITLAALVMSLVATLYPAWRAAKTEPAEALRYD